MTVEALDPGLVRALSRPEAYPEDPSARAGVEHVQTHLSHVFLTRERVYKLRKAVQLGFVDFGSRASRNADCGCEVALNRRLAHDVYLGIAPLIHVKGGFEVGRATEAPDASGEQVVVMRRLPAGRDALSLLEKGQLTPRMLDAAAEQIAELHASNGLGRPAPFSRSEWLQRTVSPVAANFAVLGTDETARAAERLATAFAAEHAQEFETRRLEGRGVDGHGDLHLQHLWFEHDESLRIIDCLEFREDLRQIDAASDVAFLAMDLTYRERPAWAERVLAHYAQRSDDYGLYRVVDYFMSYRAAVRAKVAALAARDPAIDPDQRAGAHRSAAAHLKLAVDALGPRAAGGVIALCGSAGTGKSSVAAEIADACSAVVVSSDRVRKRLAGLPETTRTPAPWSAGQYTPEAKRAVYAALLDRADPVVASGRTVVLDATFGERAERDRLARWAAEHELDVCLVEVTCDLELVRTRLAQRAASGHDPSDAGPELVDASARAFEPPTEWPQKRHLRVDTSAPDWRRSLQLSQPFQRNAFGMVGDRSR